MKIIDAINKINNEEKFKFRLLSDGDIYKYIGGSLYNETVGERAVWIIDNKWLNEEVEIIEEEKKIPEKLEDRAKFQYSEIPTWLEKKEIIKVINENFEKHQKAIYELIDYLKSKGE